MDFKHQYGEEKVSVLLPQRSLLVMSGESRLKWTHGLVQYLKSYNYTCYTRNHGNHTYRYFSLLQYPCEGYTTQP